MIVVNLCKKDLKLAFREIGIIIIAGPVFVAIGIIYLTFFLKGDFDIINNYVFSGIIAYLPAVLLMMNGFQMIGELMTIEKANNVNQVFYSENIRVSSIFFSKLLAVLIVSLIQSVVLILILNGCFFIKKGNVLNVPLSAVFEAVFLYPMVSMAFIEIYTLVMLLIRQTEVFATFLPIGGLMLLLYLGFLELERKIVMDLKTMIIMAIAEIIINIAVILIVIKIPKEHMIKLETK